LRGSSPPSRIKIREGFWLGLQPYFSSSSVMVTILSFFHSTGFPVGGNQGLLDKGPVLPPGEGGAEGRLQEGENLRVVVDQGVQVVGAAAAGVRKVLLVLVPGEEPPAAVGEALVRLLPVAVAHPAALHHHPVGGDAAPGALPFLQEGPD